MFAVLALGVPLLPLSACTATDEPGTSVTVSATHRGSLDDEGRLPTPTAGPRQFLAADGTPITLESGWIVVESVEFLRCETSWLRRIVPELLSVPTAYAHADESPTKIGEPMALSLTSIDGELRALGRLEPPPGDYCAIRIELAPADRDTRALPSSEMVGLSFRLVGHAGEEERPFVISSTDRSQITLDLAHLSLAPGHPADVVLGWVYDRWFDGVDFDSPVDTRRTVVHRNIDASMFVSARAQSAMSDAGLRNDAR